MTWIEQEKTGRRRNVLTRGELPKHAPRLDALYATLPALQCQGKCQASCGPIQGSEIENDRIFLETGKVLADLNNVCRLLVDGACSVYAVRPMICRLYGIAREMACPHGCEPERWLTEDEVHRYLRTVFLWR